MFLFGLDGEGRSEASRLLQLAREQPLPNIPIDGLLARHQELLQAGSALPAWASGFAPHSPSLLSLLGAGPIAAGLAAAGAILATVVMTTQWPSEIQAEGPPEALLPERAPVEVEPRGAQIARAESAQPAEEAAAPASSATPITTNLAPTAVAARPLRSDLRAKADLRDRSSRAERRAAESEARSEDVGDAAHKREAEPEAMREADPARQPEPQPARARAPATTDAQLAEMREIQRVERLLSDDPGEALALTRTMRTGFPEGHFREERDYLEVMALSELGRTREMHAKAAAFLRAYPTGLYSRRVRKVAAAEAE